MFRWASNISRFGRAFFSLLFLVFECLAVSLRWLLWTREWGFTFPPIVLFRLYVSIPWFHTLHGTMELQLHLETGSDVEELRNNSCVADIIWKLIISWPFLFQACPKCFCYTTGLQRRVRRWHSLWLCYHCGLRFCLVGCLDDKCLNLSVVSGDTEGEAKASQKDSCASNRYPF